MDPVDDPFGMQRGEVTPNGFCRNIEFLGEVRNTHTPLDGRE